MLIELSRQFSSRCKQGVLAIIIWCASTALAQAQWQFSTPGGIQAFDLFEHPGEADHLYLCGVGGIWESEDGGSSWHGSGQTGEGVAFTMMALTGGRWLVGTSDGVYYSDDEGDHWTKASGISARPIATLAATQDGRILAGSGWSSMTEEEVERYGFATVGAGLVYYSDDQGQTWQSATYESSVTGDKNVISIQPDLMGNGLYLASTSGVYASSDQGGSWEEIPMPSGAQTCQGIALSEDGERLYAAFDFPASSLVYAAQVADLPNWKLVSFSTLSDLPTQQARWWKPVIVSQTSNTDELWILDRSGQNGIYKVTFEWDDLGLVGDDGWKAATLADAFFGGWEAQPTRLSDLTFTQDGGIWVTTGEGIYRASQASLPLIWQARYTQQVGQETNGTDTIRRYQSTGLDGLGTSVAAGAGQYRVMGTIGGTLLESHDEGRTWANALEAQHVDALGTVQIGAEQYALAGLQVAGGQGLYAKPLGETSFFVPWQAVVAGLPNGKILDISPSQSVEGQCDVTVEGQGIYRFDLADALSGGTVAEAISGNASALVFGELAFLTEHPSDPNEAWVAVRSGTERGVYRGRLTGGVWSWQRVFVGLVEGFGLLENEDEVIPIVAAKWTDGGNRPANGSVVATQVAYSEDHGQRWEMGLDLSRLATLLPSATEISKKGLDAGGLATHTRRAYISFQSNAQGLGFGVVEGVYDAVNRQMLWFGFTDDWGGAVTREMVTFQSRDTVLILAAGHASGLWERIVDLPLATGIDEKPTHFIRLYPNPASEYFTIELPAPAQEIGLAFFDASGRRLQGWHMHQDGRRIQVDISQMPKGDILLLRLSFDGQTASIQIQTN